MRNDFLFSQIRFLWNFSILSTPLIYFLSISLNLQFDTREFGFPPQLTIKITKKMTTYLVFMFCDFVFYKTSIENPKRNCFVLSLKDKVKITDRLPLPKNLKLVS